MGISQHELNVMHRKASEKPNGVYGYNGTYWYGVKNNNLVLIGERGSGKCHAVAGAFLVDRGIHMRKDLKKIMERSL